MDGIELDLHVGPLIPSNAGVDRPNISTRVHNDCIRGKENMGQLPISLAWQNFHGVLAVFFNAQCRWKLCFRHMLLFLSTFQKLCWEIYMYMEVTHSPSFLPFACDHYALLMSIWYQYNIICT